EFRRVLFRSRLSVIPPQHRLPPPASRALLLPQTLFAVSRADARSLSDFLAALPRSAALSASLPHTRCTLGSRSPTAEETTSVVGKRQRRLLPPFSMRNASLHFLLLHPQVQQRPLRR